MNKRVVRIQDDSDDDSDSSISSIRSTCIKRRLGFISTDSDEPASSFTNTKRKRKSRRFLNNDTDSITSIAQQNNPSVKNDSGIATVMISDDSSHDSSSLSNNASGTATDKNDVVRIYLDVSLLNSSQNDTTNSTRISSCNLALKSSQMESSAASSNEAIACNSSKNKCKLNLNSSSLKLQSQSRDKNLDSEQITPSKKIATEYKCTCLAASIQQTSTSSAICLNCKVATSEENSNAGSSSNSATTKSRRRIKRPISESDSNDSVSSARISFQSFRINRRNYAHLIDSDSSSSDGSSIISEVKRRQISVIQISDTDSSCNNNMNGNCKSDSESDGSDIVVKKSFAKKIQYIDANDDEQDSDSVSESENDKVLPQTIVPNQLDNLSDSNDEDSEKCPICLLRFSNQDIGTPETCDHNFCADCIEEWARNVNTCPIDRQIFTLILIREHINGKVVRTISVDVRRHSVDELIQEDPTFCEVCGLSDREDRLLLCDGCDLGYHLECLDPPMDTVPIEEWFCSDCYVSFNELNEEQVHNYRQYQAEHRLLPRTRQTERIRATIETNRNHMSFPPNDQPSSSSLDFSIPGSSHSALNSRRKTKKLKRNSQQKKSKRKKIKNSGRRRFMKKSKTVKKRLAFQLGICAQKKGHFTPQIAGKTSKNNVVGRIDYQRNQAGIPTLHLFGERDQLDYFSESDDDLTITGDNVLTQVRFPSNSNRTLQRITRRKTAIISPAPPVSVNPCDILGSILDSQEKFLSKNSVITVTQDGTLHIEQKKRDRRENRNEDTDQHPDSIVIVDPNNRNNEIETTQAPMFSGRGGNNNRQPYNFYRGGYRGSDNRYDGNTGGNFNQYQSGGFRNRHPLGNTFSARPYFGGGYVNYQNHVSHFPFRGRGGPRYPNRRHQIPQQQFHNNQTDQQELNLEEPMEQTVVNNQSSHQQQQEDDVDIYSDIEASSSAPNDDNESTRSVTECKSNLVSKDYNHSGSDDDSGAELVIDDTVKDTDKHNQTQAPAAADVAADNYEPTEFLADTNKYDSMQSSTDVDKCDLTQHSADTDKYDPTQPSADTESSQSSSSGLNLNSSDINIEKLNEVEKQDEEKELKEIKSSSESLPLPIGFSSDLVNEAVEQVINEHRIRSNINDDDYDNDDADDEANEEEDCPNSCIYSSTSLDIAKLTDITTDIPKETNSEQENSRVESEEFVSSTKLKDSSWDSGDDWNDCETESNGQSAENLFESTCENENLKTSDSLKLEKQNDERTSNNCDVNEPIISSITENSITPTLDKHDTEVFNDCQLDLNEKTMQVSNSDEIIENTQIIESSVTKEGAPPSSPLVETINVEPSAAVVKPQKSLPIKIAFNPKRKYISAPKTEKVVQLYDDSDWEEWEAENETDKPLLQEKSIESDDKINVSEFNKITEAISEEERSYTPCLDEREPIKSQGSTDEAASASGIGGMETELISDEERNDMFDESHDMKMITDGDALEINAKESELELTRPDEYEEGEIIEKLAAKKVLDVVSLKPSLIKLPEDDKKKRSKKKIEREMEKEKTKEFVKHSKKPEFKKLSKNNRDRNYRDKDKNRGRSEERKNKEKKLEKKKKERKRDLERYNVRSILAEKPKKDQFGRDIKSLSKSSRSRSRSWTRSRKRKRRSSSLNRSQSKSFSRSISRGKSSRNSRNRFRRSKTPRRSKISRLKTRRSRSKSIRRSRSIRGKRYRVERRTFSRERDRMRYRNKSVRQSIERLRSKKRQRTVSKTRVRSRSISPGKHRLRGEWGRSGDNNRRQSFNRNWTPSWSRSPSPSRQALRQKAPQSVSPSWTPPLAHEKGPVQPENLTVILTNNEINKAKKKEKKKKLEKKTKEDFKKKKRSDKTPPPSKEIFASGDNILVSVKFNKTNKPNDENAAQTIKEINRDITTAIIKRKRDEATKKKKDKQSNEKRKKRIKSPRLKKKNKEIANLKPVAIIDLDRSPFKELTPSPKDIIVLSDSDNCEKEDGSMSHHNIMQVDLETLDNQIQEDSAPQSPTNNYLNSTGPKTPPEPQIKFLLTSKQTQLRTISNPLHDPNDEADAEVHPPQELEHRLDDMLHKGPNTPPEPPSSPPSSPDAYNPFEPTKSRSATPDVQSVNIQPVNSSINVNSGDKTELDADLVDLAVGPLESSQKSVTSLNDSSDKGMNSPERLSQTLTPPITSSDQAMESSDSAKNDLTNKNSPERNSIGVIINQQVQPQFPAVVKPIITTSSSTAPNSLSRTNVFTQPSISGTPRIVSSVPQRIILPTPSKVSSVKMSPLKTSPSKPPIKSTPIKPMPSKTMISKLPAQNIKPITPVRKTSQSKVNNRSSTQNGNEVIDVDMELESPYSPGSSDYEDLFEPPVESIKSSSTSRNQSKPVPKSPSKSAFDALFGCSPIYRPQNIKNKSKTNTSKVSGKMNKKTTPTKTAGTKTVGVKLDEENLKILDDLPNSAVEMQVKDKFLKKLNRQERVVEEVKLVLKPHYNKKHITKDQYKDILRRAVPKICHNRSGEINPQKIQNLIEAYVKKFRHHKKSASSGTNANVAQTKQSKTFWS